MARADYLMIGGFLGAGKTTAMLRLAERLSAQGRRVGLITNDQSHGLVDTTLAEASGFPVQEITGGCFCCRFNSLTEAAERLTADARPDVFLAEPVGSCTDLRATVQYPLRRMYGDDYRVAPLSVLVDPVRALRILGLEPGPAFSPKVRYVYDKQLEEADLILVNKIDLIDDAQRERLEAALSARYPRAAVFAIGARRGTGIDDWLARLDAADAASWPAPDIDYDIYAEGEALLGWLNVTARLAAADPWDGNALLTGLAAAVQARVVAGGPEIAHFKMTLTPDDGLGDLGVLNLVAGDRSPEQTHHLEEPITAAELIINLRAEGDPEELRAAVTSALQAGAAGVAATCTVVHSEHFRPSRPVPTYRVITA